MLRRLHLEQPEGFAFTPGNLDWAETQITKYPEGRQASAIIPLLWRAQEQEGWLTRPAIERVAEMLGLAYIRALEVATFYFMFQLQPVGSVAHVQICGTTSCMICGAEDLIGVCRAKIAPVGHMLSDDGRFSWEEVECLGACSNAPMAQIGKDYYEDLTPDRLGDLIDAFTRGEVPRPGPQNGRFASEPLGGRKSLTEGERALDANASVMLAELLGDTVARITGREQDPAIPEAAARSPEIDQTETSDETADEVTPERPPSLGAPHDPGADDLTLIKGVTEEVQDLLHAMGYYHFGQVSEWTPEQAAWIDRNVAGHDGEATRDGWVEQARVLAEEGSTPHAQAEIDDETAAMDDATPADGAADDTVAQGNEETARKTGSKDRDQS